MAGITLTEANSILANLVKAATTGALSVKYKDDEVINFKNRAELDQSINFWDRKVKELTRQQSGGTGHNWARGRFVKSTTL